MSGRKKSVKRKPGGSSHLRIMEEPTEDVVNGGGASPAPFEATVPTMLSVSLPADDDLDEPTDQPTDSSESLEMATRGEVPSRRDPSLESDLVTDACAEAEDHEGEDSHDEIVSGEVPNLLHSLDRRQNQVLEELDRLNARIDTLIAELHQQREDHQAA